MKEINLINSDKKVLVDDKDYSIVSKIQWKLLRVTSESKIYDTVVQRGNKYSLNVYLYSTTKSVRILHINGNALDFTRDNISYVSPTKFPTHIKKCGATGDYPGIVLYKGKYRYNVNKSEKINDTWVKTVSETGSCDSLIEALVMFNYYVINTLKEPQRAYKTGLSCSEEKHIVEHFLSKYGEKKDHRSKAGQGVIRAVNKTSKYVGVYYSKARKSWMMEINFHSKVYRKKCESEKVAAIEYNKKAVELYGKYAKLNVIE